MAIPSSRIFAASLTMASMHRSTISSLAMARRALCIRVPSSSTIAATTGSGIGVREPSS